MPDRFPAPELGEGGGWIGVNRPLTMAGLRGRAVLVHFWAASSVACHRLLAELRPLEDLFGDDLVVIGVHSPRFPREADHRVVERSVARHAIAHPVLDDADHRAFEAFGAADWPTVVLVDTEGDVYGSVVGEGCGPALEKAVKEVLDDRRPARRRRRLPVADRPLLPVGPLAFPGKVACSADGRRLAVADTAHDRVLICSLAGVVLEAHTGFLGPQGVRFDSTGVVVCDTGADRVVRTDGEVLADSVVSPWDLAADGRTWVVAEAGGHRLVRARPGELRVRLVAGTGTEGAQDGPAARAMLAQPSGVARTAEGVVFVDAGTSALRLVAEERRGEGQVSTLAGGGPLECGDQDGPAAVARLQCPLGVAAGPDGGPVYVADAYNSALRVWEGAGLRTLAVDGLAHPGGLDLLPDGRLVVADTDNHRIVVVDPRSGTLEPVDIDETWVHGTDGPDVRVAGGGTGRVAVGIAMVDEDLVAAAGAPVRVTVEARPASLLAGPAAAWSLESAEGVVEIRGGAPGHGLLLVEVTASTTGRHGPAKRVQRRRHVLEVTGP